jgi:hypothetical protein
MQHVRPSAHEGAASTIVDAADQHVSHPLAKQSVRSPSPHGEGGAGTQQKNPRDAFAGKQSAWMSSVGWVPGGQFAYLPGVHVPPCEAQSGALSGVASPCASTSTGRAASSPGDASDVAEGGPSPWPESAARPQAKRPGLAAPSAMAKATS